MYWLKLVSNKSTAIIPVLIKFQYIWSYNVQYFRAYRTVALKHTVANTVTDGILHMAYLFGWWTLHHEVVYYIYPTSSSKFGRPYHNVQKLDSVSFVISVSYTAIFDISQYINWELYQDLGQFLPVFLWTVIYVHILFYVSYLFWLQDNFVYNYIRQSYTVCIISEKYDGKCDIVLKVASYTFWAGWLC